MGRMRLSQEGVVFALALSEPLLRDELFLLGTKHDPRLLLDQVLGSAGIEPQIDLEVEAMPSTLGLVESGIGYTILSYSSVHHLGCRGTHQLLADQEPLD